MPTRQARTSTVEERLAHLERRLDQLDDAAPRARSTATSPVDDIVAAEPEKFWALRGLQERSGADGAVLLTGAVTTPAGEKYLWQQARPTTEILDDEWSERASALAALGHPVRLMLLQYVLLGVRTTAELNELAEVNTTGQLHHHLKELVAARWLTSTGRGKYAIPPERVVPLLAIIEAGTP